MSTNPLFIALAIAMLCASDSFSEPLVLSGREPHFWDSHSILLAIVGTGEENVNETHEAVRIRVIATVTGKYDLLLQKNPAIFVVKALPNQDAPPAVGTKMLALVQRVGEKYVVCEAGLDVFPSKSAFQEIGELSEPRTQELFTKIREVRQASDAKMPDNDLRILITKSERAYLDMRVQGNDASTWLRKLVLERARQENRFRKRSPAQAGDP